ncbi:DNA polymerase epsilon catalytic subunit [Rhizopus stolonifer]|uniref:DNA polymerase epsilon catalytic subunit n=1 Tax=Rhizopus stolonifer TaxID=4846 RepID=A0A367K5M8_RHIST|nr:DNA polymerase epsilon catalytic subunit [Rhizopus stolonifer]
MHSFIDIVSDTKSPKKVQKQNKSTRASSRKKAIKTFLNENPTSDVDSQSTEETTSFEIEQLQVIQIAETEIAGEYKLWALVQDQLHDFLLTVPRMFYLNSTESDPKKIKIQTTCQLDKSSKTLPRSCPPLNLFQVTMSESEFQAEEAKASNILNQPFPNAVFETQIPLSNLTKHFDLSQLKRIASDYLSNPKAFHYIYLFHGYDDNGQHFLALVGAALPVSQLFLVGPCQEFQSSSVEHIYKQIYKTRENEAGDIIEIPETIAFETNHYTNEYEAMQAINRVISDYQDAKKGNSIIIIDSPNPAGLIHHATKLRDFPFFTITKKSNRDLDWPTELSRLFTSYMALGKWVNEKASQARYANVPICNIPDDARPFLSDIMFARELIRQDMVLWWSDRKETEELENPEINNQGAYESVCAEFDFSHLCINTLIVSPLIHKLEDTAGSSFNYPSFIPEEHTHRAKDTTISRETLGVLRSTAIFWMESFIIQKDNVGGSLLESFQKWVFSPDSFMYDRCLVRMLQGMMKKVFYHLLSEARQLGLIVVFANFHRLLITSARDKEEDAIPLFLHFQRTIQQTQVFQCLVIKYRRYWDTLLWMDEWNFAGILVGHNGDIPRITKYWSIDQNLSLDAKKKFTHYTSMYLYMMAQIKRKYPDSGRDKASELIQYVGGELALEVTHWLKKISFDQSTSSTDSAVEFIKLLFGVLNLDSRVNEAVTPLKRDLLSSIAELSDFSEKAQFRNPVPYYKLTNVCCSYCNHITDLDIRRDPELKADEDWKCKKCASDYSKLDIELSLIAKMNEMIRSFQEQDLECVRCHKRRERRLQIYCGRCGGNFVLTKSKEDTIKNIQTFKMIAIEYHASLLEEVVESYLKLIN